MLPFALTIFTGAFLLFQPGRMLWPFLVLVGAFLLLVVVSMRGTGAAPTVVRSRRPAADAVRSDGAAR